MENELLGTRLRLIVLLDGTWNEDEYAEAETNIVRLRNCLALSVSSDFRRRTIEEVNQNDDTTLNLNSFRYGDYTYCVFYERGVGTGPGLDRALGGALGWGLTRNIRRAYKFICRHFVPHCQIFVFGFSRGAFTARSLVGYIGSAGVLKPNHCTGDLENKAWAYYRTTPNDRLPGDREFLETYCQPSGGVRISCLGVFDTVGALGIPTTLFQKFNRQSHEFHDIQLSPIVKLNLHALAIDEAREPFEASVWRQGRFRARNSVTEQTWFAGVHADIGGGYITKEARNIGPRPLDDISLDWMIKRIKHHYPDFPIFERAWGEMFPERGRDLPEHHESRTWKYRFYSPALRSISNNRPTVRNPWRVVSFNRDTLVVSESVHISAIERLARKAPYRGNAEFYLPPNLIYAMPNLLTKYCDPVEKHYSPDTLSITLWDGEIVNPNPSHCGVKALEQVREALAAAEERLRALGIDVHSQDFGMRKLWKLRSRMRWLRRPKRWMGRTNLNSS